VCTALLNVKTQAFYSSPSDWVFAADNGKPRWADSTLRGQILPAAERAGIGKIGWHTFRHSYSSILRSLGTDVKVQQELLRHADVQTTMNIYTQAPSDAKRTAQSKVVQMVLGSGQASSA
jgi:integrase